MGSGHSLRLDTGTAVIVVSTRVIELQRGAVYVDSTLLGSHADGSVEIRTPLGTVRDLGTQFEVRSSAAALRVRVREGTVVVQVPDAAADVGVGQELERGANGELPRRAMSDVRALEWTTSITPLLDIHGRPLQQFLEWHARERGLRLQFLSPEAARAAGVITLSGSVDGMTLDEALAAVLSTSRLSASVARGVLRVEMSKEDGASP